MQSKTLFLVEVAIFATIAFLLDKVASFYSVGWAYGGSISLSMVPVALIGLRWGLKGSFAAGILLGLLQMITGASFIHYIQIVVEYPVAFGVLGLSALFAPKVRRLLQEGKNSWIGYVILAAFLANTARFLIHFYAGIIYWGEYAPEGTPVVEYSLIYNLGYMVPTFMVSTIAVILVVKAMPKFIVPMDRKTKVA